MQPSTGNRVPTRYRDMAVALQRAISFGAILRSRAAESRPGSWTAAASGEYLNEPLGKRKPGYVRTTCRLHHQPLRREDGGFRDRRPTREAGQGGRDLGSAGPSRTASSVGILWTVVGRDKR